MRVLCLFEQSGTFKSAFQANGHVARDIDIENRFNAADIQIDLFKAIETHEIDNYLRPYDLIMAFFPCTWFSVQNDLILSGKHWSMRNWSVEKRAAYMDKRLAERAYATDILHKLVRTCHWLKKPLIIENPTSPYTRSILGEPYLSHTRNKYGDYFRKPTDWYCFGNVIINEKKLIRTDTEPTSKITDIKNNKDRKINRSLISPLYADNIVRAIEVF